jgi:hypothetical protein
MVLFPTFAPRPLATAARVGAILRRRAAFQQARDAMAARIDMVKMWSVGSTN